MGKQILITGISGFIARQTAMLALNSGFQVRGTVRDLKKGERVTHSLAASGCNVGNLSLVEANLTHDDGWQEAVNGCDGVMHIASPFPMTQARDRFALVPEAEGGTLRVLKAAKKAGVKRIILTSSMVAVMYREGRGAVETMTENDWTDVNWKALGAYHVSKTQAEKAAWDFMDETKARHQLITINPGLVLGRLMDNDFGTSVEMVRMFMKGRYPAVPPLSLPVVDVRDVALMHLRAFERPETAGRRLLASAGSLTMAQLVQIIREIVPEHASKCPKRELPACLVRLLAKFDRNLAAVLPDIGTRVEVDMKPIEELLGMVFRSPREAVEQTALSLVQRKLV